MLPSCHGSRGHGRLPCWRHPWSPMPHATRNRDATHAVVFSPLDATGRAELVEQRLTDAIVAACCETASACRASRSSPRASGSPSSPRGRRSRACATRGSSHAPGPRRRELRHLRPRCRPSPDRHAAAETQPHRAARPRAAHCCDRRDGRGSRGRSRQRRRPRDARRRSTSAPISTAGGAGARSAASISKSPRSASPRAWFTRSFGCRRRLDRCSGCACGSRSTVTSAPQHARISSWPSATWNPRRRGLRRSRRSTPRSNG